MYESDFLEGLSEISPTERLSMELTDTQRDYINEVIPSESDWKDLSVADKRSIVELIETRIEEIGIGTDAPSTDILPAYLNNELSSPYCDSEEYSDSCCTAVKDFYERDSQREIPYAEASVEQREAYLKEFYAEFAEKTGSMPPLGFEPMPFHQMGAYNPVDNTIMLNSSLLEMSDPHELLDTILHESRHAYQEYAVEHPCNVNVDTATLAQWEENFNNYVDSTLDFEGYFNQPIEVDARNFAEQTINNGSSYLA